MQFSELYCFDTGRVLLTSARFVDGLPLALEVVAASDNADVVAVVAEAKISWLVRVGEFEPNKIQFGLVRASRL